MTGRQKYWLLWASVSFVSFIVPELIAVFTDWRNTLSATVWDLEGLTPGQPLDKWGTAHVLIGGVLLVVLVWLIGHLVLGIWTTWKGGRETVYVFTGEFDPHTGAAVFAPDYLVEGNP